MCGQIEDSVQYETKEYRDFWLSSDTPIKIKNYTKFRIYSSMLDIGL